MLVAVVTSHSWQNGGRGKHPCEEWGGSAAREKRREAKSQAVHMRTRKSNGKREDGEMSDDVLSDCERPRDVTRVPALALDEAKSNNVANHHRLLHHSLRRLDFICF